MRKHARPNKESAPMSIVERWGASASHMASGLTNEMSVMVVAPGSIYDGCIYVAQMRQLPNEEKMSAPASHSVKLARKRLSLFHFTRRLHWSVLKRICCSFDRWLARLGAALTQR